MINQRFGINNKAIYIQSQSKNIYDQIEMISLGYLNYIYLSICKYNILFLKRFIYENYMNRWLD